MNKADLERAAQWLDHRAEACNELLAAALKASAFEMREEAVRGCFIEPIDSSFCDQFISAYPRWTPAKLFENGGTGSWMRPEDGKSICSTYKDGVEIKRRENGVEVPLACPYGQEGYCFKCAEVL